jgi:hypothetical protein
MTEHALEPAAQPDPVAAPAPVAGVLPEDQAGDRGEAPRNGTAAPDDAGTRGEGPATCTQAQLRRFIKSRPYVPLHELRRRFGLSGLDDDVSPVDVDGRRIFVGLPARESGLLGELLRQGDVGYELLLDPTSPIVIGVFPMRPVQRP